MQRKKYVMALDQGTTSSRCILFDRQGNVVSMAQKEFTQIYPKTGWVEHDAMEIWSSQYGVAAEAMAKIGADAGDDHRVGQEHRGAGVQCDMLAMSQNCGQN